MNLRLLAVVLLFSANTLAAEEKKQAVPDLPLPDLSVSPLPAKPKAKGKKVPKEKRQEDVKKPDNKLTPPIDKRTSSDLDSLLNSPPEKKQAASIPQLPLEIDPAPPAAPPPPVAGPAKPGQPQPAASAPVKPGQLPQAATQKAPGTQLPPTNSTSTVAAPAAIVAPPPPPAQPPVAKKQVETLDQHHFALSLSGAALAPDFGVGGFGGAEIMIPISSTYTLAIVGKIGLTEVKSKGWLTHTEGIYLRREIFYFGPTFEWAGDTNGFHTAYFMAGGLVGWRWRLSNSFAVFAEVAGGYCRTKLLSASVAVEPRAGIELLLF